MVMQHTWSTLRNIYCHLIELRFLHCVVVLCDCMTKRDSQIQDGCYRKWIGGTLQIWKTLKQGEDLVAGEVSYQCHNCPGAQSIVS